MTLPKIRTLDEILADMSDQAFAVQADARTAKSPSVKLPAKQDSVKSTPQKSPKKLSQTPKAPNKPAPIAHQDFVSGSVSNKADDSLAIAPCTLPDATTPNLDALLENTPRSALFVTDKETNRLRWLAFYYLSRREHSRHELQNKLLAKGCDLAAILALLDEFAQKGYQSDERTAHMIVREGLRKGRGAHHIKQALKKSGVKLSYGFDEAIRLAHAQGVADGMLADRVHPAHAADQNCDHQDCDWLYLAVSVRTKKYGDYLPRDLKDKARQLRFLQYRGFEISVCYQALKMTLADFADSP